ncbi:hypothetical protein [Dysgonomonas sp. 520]|uniref:hypothetical protein n=1 Tax=Dysgonomonas sp. 520 TaxID=2302931 RepID=UPI0013D57D19|nr:hypothetical protein [Dysgonomonas sp. 520]NDW09617.1 hypothetical protein [Dysgonomonas sp. 520]
MRNVLLVSILLCNLILHGAMYELEGTIGKYPIFMQLETYDDGDIRGTYYYKSSLKDIVVSGRLKAGVYKMTVESEYDKVSETFTLRRSGNNFTGTWVNDKKKSLAVSLKPLNAAPYKSLYDHLPIMQNMREEDPYSYVRMSFVALKRDTVEVKNGKSIVWFTEKHCDMPFFRLGNGFSKDQLSKVNPLLDEKHLDFILAQLTCASPWTYNEGSSVGYRTSVDYLSDDLLGFEVFASYYCGGAHPDFYTMGFLVDLHSGSEYKKEDVYDISTEQLLKVLQSEHHFTPPTDDDDYCDYTDSSIWEYPSFSFTEGGVRVIPSFFRAARSCEVDFFIPYSKLNAYKLSSFPYTLK